MQHVAGIVYQMEAHLGSALPADGKNFAANGGYLMIRPMLRMRCDVNPGAGNKFTGHVGASPNCARRRHFLCRCYATLDRYSLTCYQAWTPCSSTKACDGVTRKGPHRCGPS